MKPAHLFWMVAAAGVFGLFVPGDRQAGDAHTESTEAQAGGGKSGNAANLAWYGGETVLERVSDGHFYAEAHVDGLPVLFLVDTGASVVALTAEDAIDAGLHWEDADLQMIGHGANGPVQGVRTTIKEMELGGFRSRNVEAVIVPQGLQISLLGQSFLSQIENVEISDDRMVLSGGY